MQYGEVMKLYIYNIENLTQTEYEKWYNLMSAEKKQKVDRLKFEKDKKCSVVGEMLARKGIAEIKNISPEEINFSTTPKGKPVAKNIDIYFNISHSDNMVLCGVSEFEIGIDIEKIRPINLNIAKKICLKNELEYIYSDEKEQLNRLFEVWTGKEAVFKYKGTGLTDFKTVDTLNNPLLQKPIYKDGYIIRVASSESV